MVEEEDTGILSSSDEEEEKRVLRNKGKGKRKVEEKLSPPMEDNLEEVVATPETPETTNTQAMEDTEMEEDRDRKGLEESR